MTLAAKLYFEEQSGPNGRMAERRPVQAESTLRDGDSRPVDISIVDLSTSGCLIEGAGDLEVPSLVTVGIAGVGRVAARIVRRDGNRFGCAFVVPLAESVVAAANATDTVVHFPAAVLPTPNYSELSTMPDPDRLPRPMRAAILFGGALAVWALIFAVV